MVELSDSLIDAFYFDEEGHFAGFRFVNAETGEIFEDTPLNAGNLKVEKNEELEMKDYKHHTRLVGFRTTKSCHGAKNIMSLQPIYYSVNKQMCEEHLQSLSMGMLEEIPFYGPECAEVSRMESPSLKYNGMATPSKSASENESNFKQMTYLLVWISSFLVFCLTASHVKQYFEERSQRIRNKQSDLRMGAQEIPMTTMANVMENEPKETGRNLNDLVDDPKDAGIKI